MPKRTVVVRSGGDALGYDTRDFAAAARETAADALSGRNGKAVSAELESVRRRLAGLRR